MDLSWSFEESSFSDAVRGTLAGIHKQLAPKDGAHRQAAVDDLRLWRTAQSNGWLDMAQPGSIRENLVFAALLMRELGRAAITTPLAETVAAHAAIGFAGAVTESDSTGDVPMRTLASADARCGTDLSAADGADPVQLDHRTGQLVLPWAHHADEVIVPVRGPGRDPESLSILALANPGDRQLVAPASVLDHDELGIVPLDGKSLAVLWRKILTPGEQAGLWDGLSVARLLRGWEMLGHAWSAMELTASHVTKRTQFGRTLGSMEPVQQRLADMWLALESAELIAAEATCLAAAGRAFRPLAECASFACGRAAETVALHAIHLHGGTGYMWEYDLHWHYRRVKTLRVRQGTAQQQLNGVATEMLAEVARLPSPSWTFDEYAASP